MSNQKNRQKEVLKIWTDEATARGNRKITASAPDARQHAVYQAAFALALRNKKKRVRVLNLGMTPELRNLALGLGCEVVAVDINFDMIVNLEHNIRDNTSLHNMILRCDWLKIDQFLRPDTFDIVSGDGVIAQVTLQQAPLLIKNIALLLKSGGYFISRVDVFQPNFSTMTVDQLLKLYRQKKISLIEFALATVWYSEHAKKLYNPRTGLQKTYKFWDIMQDYYEEGKLTKVEYQAIEERRISISHYSFTMPHFLKIMHRYFLDVSLKQSMPIWPTYVGKKKA